MAREAKGRLERRKWTEKLARTLTIALIIALVGSFGAGAPASARDGTERSLTILAARCPADYVGNASADECDDSPISGAPFQIAIPFTEAITDAALTDDEGLVTIPFEGIPLDGSLRVIESLPSGTERFVVYCVDDMGTELSVTYDDYSTSNPGLGVADISVGDASAVFCDWYHVPTLPVDTDSDESAAQNEDCATSDTLTNVAIGPAMYRGDAARTGEQPGPGPEGVPLPDETFLSRLRPPLDGSGMPACSVRIEEGTPVIASGGTVYIAGAFRAPGSLPTMPERTTWGLAAVSARDGGTRWFAPLTTASARAFLTAPTVANGEVYIGDDNGGVHSRNTVTGSERWVFETGSYFSSSPVIDEGIVYVTTGDGMLYAVDAGTGEEQWHLWLGDWSLTDPAVSDAVVYVGTTDGVLYAIDGTTGVPRWRYELKGQTLSGPTIAGGLVFTTNASGTLVAVDATDGTARWRVEVPANPEAVASSDMDTGTVFASPAVVDGVVYTSSQGFLAAFDASDGREMWRMETDGSALSSPSVADGVVYAVSLDGALYAVDISTGDEYWTYDTPAEGPFGEDGSPLLLPAPAVMDGTVYFTNIHGWLYAVQGSSAP